MYFTFCRDEHGSTRMQALGAATLALQARELAAQGQNLADLANAQSLTDVGKASGASISVSLGSGKSQSNNSQSSETARGSSVTAGGDVNIRASGAGTQGEGSSDITVQGSEVKAGGTTRLKAEGDVQLLAAANTQSEANSQSSKSGSIGVSIAATGVSVNASASRGKGAGAGQSTTYTNSHVSGNTVLIESGGDTSLKGAVVQGDRVAAKVGGELTIESLQDSSRYQENSKSAGLSVSVPVTGGQAGGSVNAGKTRISSNYQSVTEQSGIRAGDGGFQVEVGGKTTLTGGAITSTDKAVQEGRNSFNSAGGLSISDVQNTAAYKADSSGITVGVGSSLSSSGAGVGSDKGQAGSSTQAAISGVAGNKDARTGDVQNGITPIFDKEKVKAEVGAQVAITTAFGQQAAKSIATYGDAQLQLAADKKNEAAKETDPERRQLLLNEATTLEDQWKEGGTHRVALHTLAAGLSGGAAAAMGALTSQTAIPQLGPTIEMLDVPQEVKQALTQGLAIGLGAATGGVAGAASAQNATSNNYLTPRENLTRNRAEAECRVNPGSQACTTAAQLNVLDKRRDQELAKAAQACNAGSSDACQDLTRTLNQWEAQGRTELQQLAQELKPSCAPPKDCANAANWTNNELRTLQQTRNQIWATSASGAVEPTAGPEAALAGGVVGALRLSAAGFSLGAGFDAAGQLVQNGTVRPEQSLVAGMTGAVAVPLAARGMRWTPVAGAGAAGLNTTFNNIFYDESTSVLEAASYGGVFGAAGPAAGSYVQKVATPIITNAPRIPITGPIYIPSTPTRFANVPQRIGIAVKETVSNLPSFIPLDDGKPKQQPGSKP